MRLTHDIGHAARRLVSYAAALALVGAIAAPAATFAGTTARVRQQQQANAQRQQQQQERQQQQHQQQQQQQQQTASDRQSGAANAHADDISQLQGKWERGQYPGGPAPEATRVVKEIKGNRETVTYYDQSGNVLAATTANFKVQPFGPVHVYTFESLQFTGGPRKGESERQAVSYIYHVDGDSLHEAHGLLANSPAGSVPAVVTWTRSTDSGSGGATTAGAKGSGARTGRTSSAK